MVAVDVKVTAMIAKAIAATTAGKTPAANANNEKCLFKA